MNEGYMYVPSRVEGYGYEPDDRDPDANVGDLERPYGLVPGSEEREVDPYYGGDDNGNVPDVGRVPEAGEPEEER